MRKCDICSTPIPLGSNRCPNCGFIYRKERKLNGRNDKREENKKEFMEGAEKAPVIQNNKIEEFADLSGLAISPDKQGYFGYNPKYNAYIEIKSFKKVIDDAKMRNQIFFKKLGLA